MANGSGSAARTTPRRAAITKAERDIDATLAATKDPVRAQALRGARAFKRSWIEFAEILTRVRDEEHWADWGYDSFERYCTKELHIKKETAYKLTGSYQFLRKEQPQVLKRDGVLKPLPDYRSIDKLIKAEDQLPARSGTVKELRSAVIDECLTPAATSARLKEMLPPPPPKPGDAKREARRFASQARRLLAGIQGSALLADEIPEPENMKLLALIDALENVSDPAPASA